MNLSQKVAITTSLLYSSLSGCSQTQKYTQQITPHSIDTIIQGEKVLDSTPNSVLSLREGDIYYRSRQISNGSLSDPIFVAEVPEGKEIFLNEYPDSTLEIVVILHNGEFFIRSEHFLYQE